MTADPKQVKEANDAAPGDMFEIVAESDLRVVTRGNHAVFLLKAGEPRTLPKHLALSAQVTGGEEGVPVNIRKV